MARGKTAGGDEARARILSEAEQVFASKGFHGASIRQLAKAAGMPTASMLHHYPSKEKLYVTVLARIGAELEERLEHTLATASPARWQLEAMALALVEWTEDQPDRSALLLRELLDNPGRIEAATHLPLAGFLQRFTGFLRRAKASGELVDLDPDVFFLHLVGATVYFPVALPTLRRVAPRRSEAALRKEHRRAIQAWIARVAT